MQQQQVDRTMIAKKLALKQHKQTVSSVFSKKWNEARKSSEEQEEGHSPSGTEQTHAGTSGS